MSIIQHTGSRKSEEPFISSFSCLQQPIYDCLIQAEDTGEEKNCIESLLTCEGSFFWGGTLYIVSLLLVPLTIAVDVIQGIALGIFEMCQG